MLVESKSAHAMWDATITAISKTMESETNHYSIIDAYRVEYKEWGSRFVEWVKPSRVVEPSEHNRLRQVSDMIL